MTSVSPARFAASPMIAWLCVVLTGLAAPALAIVWLAQASASPSPVLVGGPILALGLMGAGMIGAAAAGSLAVGLAVALLAGAGLCLLAHALGMPLFAHPFAIGLAALVAGFSFAARGALFARSASDKGWLVALAVVAGEGAVLATAFASPEALPTWLLALLPAQWASMAIGAALSGSGMFAAKAALLALAGTAAATLFVVRLWPRRWPYLVMFTVWLGLSALVWHYLAAPAAEPVPDLALAASARPACTAVLLC